MFSLIYLYLFSLIPREEKRKSDVTRLIISVIENKNYFGYFLLN
jgi:hypothetical protein